MANAEEDGDGESGTSGVTSTLGLSMSKDTDIAANGVVHGLGLTMPTTDSRTASRCGSDAESSPPNGSVSSPVNSGHPTGATRFANYSYYPPYGASSSLLSPRNQQRLATAKSACLIYCALLGLSPILKSLTKSTSSDSIWAMTSWLMCINVFFFDYGGAVGAKYDDASNETNRRNKLTKMRQAPGFALDERSVDGVDHVGLAPSLDHARLLPDPVLDRGLWFVSHLPSAPASELLARASYSHICLGGQRWRRCRYHHLWRRLDSRNRWTCAWLFPDGSRHGRVQLVVDWVAKVQE